MHRGNSAGSISYRLKCEAYSYEIMTSWKTIFHKLREYIQYLKKQHMRTSPQKQCMIILLGVILTLEGKRKYSDYPNERLNQNTLQHRIKLLGRNTEGS